jgi:3-phenylpropionate/trans-cinnamate dioxygenase ferredoxin subunit
MTEYVTIATTDEIQPGERMVVEIDNKWIVVFNVGGTYYAIEDRCPHDDGPLAEGMLHECMIECPRHGAAFDIATGKVLAPPAFTDVAVFPVRVEGGNIQLGRR